MQIVRNVVVGVVLFLFVVLMFWFNWPKSKVEPEINLNPIPLLPVPTVTIEEPNVNPIDKKDVPDIVSIIPVEIPDNNIVPPVIIVVQVEQDWKWAVKQMEEGANVCKSDSQGEYFYIRNGTIYSNSPDDLEFSYEPDYKIEGKWWKIANLEHYLAQYKKVAVEEAHDWNWAIRQMIAGKLVHRNNGDGEYFSIINDYVLIHKGTLVQKFTDYIESKRFNPKAYDVGGKWYLYELPSRPVNLGGWGSGTAEDCDQTYSQPRRSFFRRIFRR